MKNQIPVEKLKDLSPAVRALAINLNTVLEREKIVLFPELKQMKEELSELQSLFDLQRKRTLEADKMWQKANNEPDAWPDLGKLLEWLMGEIAQMKEELSTQSDDYEGAIDRINQLSEALEEIAKTPEHEASANKALDFIVLAEETLRPGQKEEWGE